MKPIHRNNIISASHILNLQNVISEIATIIFMPFILFKIRRDFLKKMEMHKLLDYHPVVGMICKYAFLADARFNMDDMHMLLSYYNFRVEYPECSLGVVLDWNNENVRKMSLITGCNV